MFNKRSGQKYNFSNVVSFQTEEIHKLHNQKNDSDTEKGNREREREKQAPDNDSDCHRIVCN